MLIDFSTLREWQKEALEKYRLSNRKDFSITATPGAGKTRAALALAQKLISVGQADHVVVVAPTDHLRTQWAEDAGNSGIFLDPSLPQSAPGVTSDYNGYVTTYAQVAVNPLIHAKRVNAKKTFVIFDEIHHAGDGLSWGVAVQEAFSRAHRRLCLTGTPFRTSIDSTIPFMHYEPQADGSLLSTTDYSYGYGEALRDHVVRPVTFAAYSGESTWQDSDGGTFAAGLSDDLGSEIERKALRGVLDPKGSWIPHVFGAAHERLLNVRANGNMPDAGGLVLAADQETATAYAKIMASISGEPVTLVISEDPQASQKIDAFKNDPHALWMVAVRMVSEGVDVPRLAVGVWATNYRTPLFFAQAIGRFVRSRARHESATIFLPSLRSLLALAAEMEEQRRHVIAVREDDGFDDLDDPILSAEELREERTLNSTINLSSEASFDHVLFNGRAIESTDSLTPEEANFVGLPGLLSPSELVSLLKSRDQEIKQSHQQSVPPTASTASAPVNLHVKIAETRRDINRLVSRISHARSIPHASVHKLAQSAVPGPRSAQATLEILEGRKEWLEKSLGL